MAEPFIRVGGWYRIGTPDGPVVKVLGITDDGRSLAKQYFDPFPHCPYGCLEGDGGYVGPVGVPLYPIHPPQEWDCPHCGDEGFLLKPPGPEDRNREPIRMRPARPHLGEKAWKCCYCGDVGVQPKAETS